ncbi:methyltransferase domain-containing protein [Candidatus Sumerlaeota bacterium]|nr:methyltransferase domain-containing protein [Candidatus Sumerlaeota bacterium]
MKNRKRGNPLGMIKMAGESQALDRCLNEIRDIRTVCDAPSGPGRMFPYWKDKGYMVHAVDISERMIEASRKLQETTGVPGTARMGDIFQLNKMLEEKPDLVASIRFLYYFNAEDRIKLLCALASASRRYVLVQYKTTETIKGQITLVRRISEEKKPQKTHLEQYAVSYNEILVELREAGLALLRIEPIGEFSDRVFVLAEKAEAGSSPMDLSINARQAFIKPRRLYLAVSLIVLFALVYFLNSSRSFFGENEAFFSLGARSVLKGEWIAPRIYNKVSPATPALMHWWIAVISIPFSDVSAQSARLSHILIMLGVLYSLYAFSRRNGRRGAGILAILILGSCYIFWEKAFEVDVDMMLTLSLTTAWGALFHLLHDSFRRKYWWLLWGGLSIGIFLIGPLALALTAVLFIIIAFPSWRLKQTLEKFNQVRPYSGIVLCLTPFLLWIGSVYLYYGADAAKHIFRHWRLINFSHFMESQTNPPYYDSSVFPLYLFPLSLLATFVIWSLFKHKNPKGAASVSINKFVFCSSLSLLLFYSALYPSGNRFLPLAPWIAFLIGDNLWKRVLAVVPLNNDCDCHEQILLGRLLGTQSGRFYAVLLICFISATAVYNRVVAHYREGYGSPLLAALEIDSSVDTDDRLFLVDNTDPRIIFYIKKKYEITDDRDADILNLQKMLSSKQEIDLLVDENDIFKFVKLRDPRIYVENTFNFQNKIYYILTNEFRPGMVPLLNLVFRRSA